MKKNPIFLLAGIALFIGIVNMKHDYYQVLRWVVFGIGAYGAFICFMKKDIGWAWILGVAALIFNPFKEFHFTKQAWAIINTVAGIMFCIYFGAQGEGKRR